jgi:hypothetical protein
MHRSFGSTRADKRSPIPLIATLATALLLGVSGLAALGSAATKHHTKHANHTSAQRTASDSPAGCFRGTS